MNEIKHEGRWNRFKEQVKKTGIPGISKANSNVILRYLYDMEIGINVSSKTERGARSPRRLLDLKDKMIFFSNKFEQLFNLSDLTQLQEEQVSKFFFDMRKGNIKRKDGTNYQSTCDFVRTFKAFWHWWVKVNMKKMVFVQDITIDLDARPDRKPPWVFLDDKQVKLLCDNAKYEYKVLMWFLFDSGVRPVIEIEKIQVRDIVNDPKDPTFKVLDLKQFKKGSFPRKIKLMLSTELIKEYIQRKGLQPHDLLFDMNFTMAVRYIKRLAKKLFGDAVSNGGKKYCDITLYSFRHCSSCYWYPKYDNEGKIKYRFGWKKTDKIFYYSEYKGFTDDISQDDMLDNVTKTQLEKKVEFRERENVILKEKCQHLEEGYQKLLIDMEKIKETLVRMEKGRVVT